MSDLIKREDAIRLIQETEEMHPYKVPGDRESFGEYAEAWNDATCLIEAHITVMPSAEPERSAKILNRSEGFYSAHGVCICGHCEQCGNAVCDDFRFCPYCGTTLDWSE